MRRTFCDRCGAQCVNTTVRLHGAIEHSTSAGEQVGYDEIRPVEVCAACYRLVKKLLGLEEIPQERDTDSVMASPVNRALVTEAPVRG